MTFIYGEQIEDGGIGSSQRRRSSIYHPLLLPASYCLFCKTFGCLSAIFFPSRLPVQFGEIYNQAHVEKFPSMVRLCKTEIANKNTRLINFLKKKEKKASHIS